MKSSSARCVAPSQGTVQGGQVVARHAAELISIPGASSRSATSQQQEDISEATISAKQELRQILQQTVVDGFGGVVSAWLAIVATAMAFGFPSGFF